MNAVDSYARQRRIDPAAMAWASCRNDLRSPLPGVIGPAPCIFVPTIMPKRTDDGGLVRRYAGGQHAWCDDDLVAWRTAGHDVRSHKTAPRSTAATCFGLDTLSGDERTVIVAEGISDYLTALTATAPWFAHDIGVIAAVGITNALNAIQALSLVIDPTTTHLILVCDNDSAKQHQGVRGMIDAAMKWRHTLNGRSAECLICHDDLSADWRNEHPRTSWQVAISDALSNDKLPQPDTWTARPLVPGADMTAYRDAIAAHKTQTQAKTAKQQRPHRPPRKFRSHSRWERHDIDTVIEALHDGDWDPIRTGDTARARCPAHAGQDDRNLAVFESRTHPGTAALKCHSRQCETADILRALGLWRERHDQAAP